MDRGHPLTPKGFAEKHDLHPQSVYRWIYEGKLSCYKLGRSIRIRESDEHKFLEERQSHKNLHSQIDGDILVIETHKRGGKMAKAKSKTCRHWKNLPFGAVYQRKFKVGWTWCYCLYDRNGERKHVSVPHALDVKMAVVALRDAVRQEFDARYSLKREMGNMLFKDFGQKYLENYSSVNKRSWRRTDYFYINAALTPFFGKYKLKDVSPVSIEKFKKKRLDDGMAKSSINIELRCLKKIFATAVKWGDADENPMNHVDFFKNTNSGPKRILTKNEERRLLETLEIKTPWLKGIVIFALHTGLRINDILTLPWNSIDIQNATAKIVQEKSGKPLTIYLNSVVLEILKKAKENQSSNGLVFGKKYDTVYNAFKRVVRLIGIDGKGADSVNLHTLRHTHASRLEENGYSEFVAVALGHSDRQTANRYVHPGEKRLREAQESLVAYSVA